MITAEERLEIAAHRHEWTLDTDFRAKLAQGQYRETCHECGFKIRGLNHNKGAHHKKRHPNLRRQTA